MRLFFDLIPLCSLLQIKNRRLTISLRPPCIEPQTGQSRWLLLLIVLLLFGHHTNGGFSTTHDLVDLSFIFLKIRQSQRIFLIQALDNVRRFYLNLKTSWHRWCHSFYLISLAQTSWATFGYDCSFWWDCSFWMCFHFIYKYFYISILFYY